MAPQKALANHADEKYWETWWEISQTRFEKPLKELLWPLILSKLEPSQRAQVANASIVWEKTLYPGSTRVTLVSGKYEIHLSLTALTILSWLNDAQEIEYAYHPDPPVFADYVEFLGKQLPEFEKNVRSGQPINKVEILPLYEVSNIGFDEWYKLLGRSDLRVRTLAADMSSLGLILSHEVGHIVLKHLTQNLPRSSDKLVRMEYDADIWAINHMVDIGFDPVRAMPFLFLFLEYDDGVLPRQRTHEISSCRGLRILTYGRDRLISNTTTVTFGPPLTKEQRDEALRELTRIRKMAQVQADCDVSKLQR